MNGGRDVGDGLAYHQLVGYNNGDDDEDEEEEGDADDKVVGGGQMWATVWRIITFRKFSAHTWPSSPGPSVLSTNIHLLTNVQPRSHTHPLLQVCQKLVVNHTHDDDEM